MRVGEQISLGTTSLDGNANLVISSNDFKITRQTTLRTLLITSMQANGQFPLADSPDNIIQSTLSMTALDTSESSALVGRAFTVMLSNICIKFFYISNNTI